MPLLKDLSGRRLGDVLDVSSLVIWSEFAKYEELETIELRTAMVAATQGRPPYNDIVLGDEVESLDDEEFSVLLTHELAHFLQYDRGPLGRMPKEFLTLLPNPDDLRVLRPDEREAIAWEARQARALGWTSERYRAFVSKLYPDPKRTLSFFNPPEKMKKIPREIKERVRMGQVFVRQHGRRTR